jgi:DNA modification methylase
MAKRKPKDQTFDTGRVLVGSCLERLKDLPDASIDSIVTDPPYELGFMGKSWDASGIAYNVELWRECLRVLKPGGHLLAFGGTRTYHRMAVAIEDAGFEIRDSIHWVYGSGFPKSLDVSKAIDKAAGVEGAVVGEKRFGKTSTGQGAGWNANAVAETGRQDVRAPATEAAKQWQGWGTALKPAHEPIVLARKPLTGTVAQNVQEHGTGAINIDASRVPGEVPSVPMGEWSRSGTTGATSQRSGEMSEPHTAGRWPANIIFDEAAGAELDEQSGTSKSKQTKGKRAGKTAERSVAFGGQDDVTMGHDDEGGASRFFYCPKPGKKERNAGLEKLKAKTAGEATDREDGSAGLNSPRAGAGRTGGSKNFHPTVKPVELMRYLCRLITPPGGTVLDPFLGSGTTAVAAILEGFQWVGCEMTPDYLPIIKGRVQWAEKQPQKLL